MSLTSILFPISVVGRIAFMYPALRHTSHLSWNTWLAANTSSLRVDGWLSSRSCWNNWGCIHIFHTAMALWRIGYDLGGHLCPIGPQALGCEQTMMPLAEMVFSFVLFSSKQHLICLGYQSFDIQAVTVRKKIIRENPRYDRERTPYDRERTVNFVKLMSSNFGQKIFIFSSWLQAHIYTWW